MTIIREENVTREDVMEAGVPIAGERLVGASAGGRAVVHSSRLRRGHRARQWLSCWADHAVCIRPCDDR
jgi:hypothetical protein